MDSFIRFICNVCYVGRFFTTLGLIFFCFLLRYEKAICNESGNLAKQVVDEIQNENLNQLMSTLDGFQKSLETSEDMIVEAREFLKELIDEMNARYSIHLTLSQVGEIAKENFRFLPVSEEEREKVLGLFDLLVNQQELKADEVFWPWKWSWFGLHKNKKGSKNFEIPYLSVQTSTPVAEIDAGLIVGFLEIVGGTAFILVFGGTPLGGIAGGGLIYDGINRIANNGQWDLDEALKERQRIGQNLSQNQ